MTRIATQKTRLTITMKTNMHTDVSNTTTTIWETPRTAGWTSTVESSTKCIKSVENTFVLNNSAYN